MTTTIVLFGILHDGEQLAAGSWDVPGLAGIQLGAHRLRVRDAQVGIVPIDLAGWLGHAPSPAERMAASRLYAAMEADGLIVRHCGEAGRTTHLQLTERGEAVARRLVAEESGRG